MKTLSKIQVGKVLLIVLSLVLTMMPTMAYAQENSVPAYISITATSIDVVVSERMTMSAAAETEDLTITPIEVTNNAAVGPVAVTNISVSILNDWQLVPTGTNFTNMVADAKKIYLCYDNHDFSEGSLETNFAVKPGVTGTIQLEGKTGIVTADVTEQQVANIILTIGIQKTVNQIIFTMEGSHEHPEMLDTFEAEAGMTWAEFIGSDYNPSSSSLNGYDKIFAVYTEKNRVAYAFTDYAITLDGSTYVKPTDEIIGGYTYRWVLD